MVKRVLKQLLKIFLVFLAVFIVLMLTPRVIGFLFPEKAPIGYHFEFLDYLAIGVGLEKLVDMEPEVPDKIAAFKNIEYKVVNGKSLQLDVFKQKDLEEKAPLLIFIHGGGWRSGKRQDYLVYLLDYAQKGYVTATISYRLKKDSVYPAAAEDVIDAVDFLFQNGDKWGYDTSRVALVGGSAGAHLAMLAAYGWQNPRKREQAPKHNVKAIVDIYGPVDMTTPYAQTQPLVTGFIGRAYNKKSELYWEASPAKYLNKDLPPTLILRGTSDNLLPPGQSDSLHARLERLGVANEYYRLPLWPHAMDMAVRPNKYMQKKMDAFFEQYVK
ncbi:alpha/beta hydrolase [Maribellus maritimus]|uniref:alpha/beta hydrolase n=1 Tax=Maribellus maritimus TaxID=2870838 RepID=UPI001EEAC56C|nr:alpha/beta hydrolase [Maribellus maritimus]MCG6186348.1 alpha/beta hydrolase [Maribellus maritimus]